jgi:drug/metabolite transporter (DMT)-like permease
MPPESSRRARGIALMFCVGLMWSMAGVFTRHLEQATRWEATFWRSAFCALAMAAILALLHRGEAARQLARAGRIGLLSGALWAVMFTCFMLALTRTSTANTLILTSLSPLTASLCARLLLGERVAARTWALMGVALAGILIMFGGELEAGEGRMAGNLIALLVPAAAGLNFTLMRKARTRVDLIPAVLLGGLFSALATLAFAWPPRATGGDLVILALLGTFQLAVPCALAVVAARHISATEVALIGLTETVFGPLWAWLGAGEVPAQHALVGGAVVLGALVAETLGRGAVAVRPASSSRP